MNKKQRAILSGRRPKYHKSAGRDDRPVYGVSPLSSAFSEWSYFNEAHRQMLNGIIRFCALPEHIFKGEHEAMLQQMQGQDFF